MRQRILYFKLKQIMFKFCVNTLYDYNIETYLYTNEFVNHFDNLVHGCKSIIAIETSLG